MSVHSFITSLIFVPVLLGCGGSPEVAENQAGNQITDPQTTEAAAEKVASEEDDGPGELSSFDPELGLDREWTGDLDGMIERNYIRALVVYSKTHYFLDGGRQRGLSYEALKLFEEALNKKLGRRTVKVHVAILPVQRDELLPALEKGLGDIAVANLTVTPERLQIVDFARPFGEGVREVVVTGPASPVLSSLDDLAGQEVNVRRTSSYWASLEKLSLQFQSRGLQPIQLVAAEEFLQDEDLLEMVHAGVLPLAVVDDHIARFWVDVLSELTLREDLVVREGGAIAWAIRKDSPQLKEMIDEFVGANRVGTLTTNILIKRYLKNNKWVRNPLSATDRKRYDATIDLFSKYGEQYGFDHLMLTALAYQESRLDQSTRSKAGAVGIMQVLPSTAADPNVDIPDISEVENNIHAGAKYLGFLRDRYFSGPELDDLNRSFFTFAAYNAGPARVRKLRAEASERGLDPNRWFGNVEQIAARRIGRETVTYVSNIAKYYIAYRLAFSKREQK